MSAVTDAMTSVEPESPRYSADLLLLHGLWSGPTLWTAVAAGMAQRGWRCHLLDLRAAAAATPAPGGLAGWAFAAAEAAKSLEAPPIAIGHDAGGLIALALGTRPGLRAALAVSPLLDGATGLVPATRRLLARWLDVAIAPPPADHRVFAGLTAESRDRLRAELRPEAGSCVTSLGAQDLVPQEPTVPTLLIGQREDAVVPPFLVEVSARGIGAEALILPGGHWPMAEEGHDRWASAVHRWIIRRVGGSILLLEGDEDLRDA